MAISLLNLSPTGQAVKNESSIHSLNVVLPSGIVGNRASFSTRGQLPSGGTQSFTRKYFQQANVLSESGWIEQIDTSPYADPDNIDGVASVIEAPELPLPPDREISSGLLRIRIFVSEEGIVDQIELIETSLQEDYSTRLIQTFKESKFNPGMLQGKPVKSWRMVEINYIDP